MPDVYGGKYRNDKHSAEELVQLYSDDVQKWIDISAANGKGISCFIAESLQSCGGQIILPPDYLRRVYKYSVTFLLLDYNLFVPFSMIGVLGMPEVSA